MSSFKAATINGEEIELEFIHPTATILTEASKIYNITFARLLSEGVLLRKKLVEHLRNQGLWDDKKQKELDDLQKSITDKEYRLHKGKIKLSEAKDLALSIKEERKAQARLLSTYNEYDNMTVEGQSDNAKFNYLVSACTVYSNSKKAYFSSYEEFASYNDPVAFIAASHYAKEFYNLDENFESSLPENKFLKKHKFVNDNLQLVNKEGKLVNADGKLVDEFGNLVDENGVRIDSYGYKRNDDGEFLDESEAFLDDDGNPIVETVVDEVVAVDSQEDSA